MVYLSRPYPFKFFKGCLPQNLLSPLLNTLSHIMISYPLSLLYSLLISSYKTSFQLFIDIKTANFRLTDDDAIHVWKDLVNTANFRNLCISQIPNKNTFFHKPYEIRYNVSLSAEKSIATLISKIWLQIQHYSYAFDSIQLKRDIKTERYEGEE